MGPHRMNIPASLARAATVLLVTAVVGVRGFAKQGVKNPEAAKLTNPVASTPDSLATGKRAYDANCAACHGNMAQGAEKAGVIISIIQEQGGKQPPDLTDDKSDY